MKKSDLMYLKILAGPSDWQEYGTILPGDLKREISFQVESMQRGYQIDLPVVLDMFCQCDDGKLLLVAGAAHLVAGKETPVHGVFLPECGSGFLALTRGEEAGHRGAH